MALCFISYARNDGSKFAERILERFDSAGILTWMDTKDIKMGDAWRQKILDGLESSYCIVVVITKTALESQYVAFEWASAIAQGKTVIPILVDDIPVPTEHPLAEINYHEFRDLDDEKKWIDLINLVLKLRQDVTVDRYVRSAEEGLNNFDGDIRKNAQDFLVKHRHPSAKEVLAKVAQQRLHPDVSFGAAKSLFIKDPSDRRGIEAFGDALIEWPETDLRFRLAIEHLQQLPFPETVVVLKRAINKNGLDRFAPQVVSALHQLNIPEAIPVLREILEDDTLDLEVRSIAAMGLSRQKDLDSLQLIIEIILKSPPGSPPIKRLASALGIFGDPVAVEPLMTVLTRHEYDRGYRGSRPDLRYEIGGSIVNALGNLKDNSGLEAIDEIDKRAEWQNLQQDINNVRRKAREKNNNK